MPHMTINDQACEFEGKKNILQVALDNGIEIPHYCYHDGLSVVASCRICLAEVAQPNPRNDNKVELIPKLLPTCQTPAGDGMAVYTKTPKAIANQKAVMEFLLINHPVDCPVCDQAGECSLQDYSYQYGRSATRFQEDKIKQPKKDIGPNVLLYSDRCIMCSRCVRFTREVTGTSEIGIFGRGNQEQIDIFPGQPLDNELSGNVVDICPVGALLDKDFLFEQRVWFLTQTPSIDGITASGDNIAIHHNDGKVYRIKPRTNPDVNKWWISDEIRFGWKFVHSEDRLASPSRLQYGVSMACDWNRAYQAVQEGFGKVVDAGGTLSLLLSPMLSCEEAYLLGKFIRQLDPNALLGIGPVPTVGEDKTFPGGYTLYAQKCPNLRGVRRALQLLDHVSEQDVLDYDAWTQKVADKENNIAGTLITGNYPSQWTTPSLEKALMRKFVVLIDTLPNAITDKADVLLPSCTWVEKSGTFENAQNRRQSFNQAIAPIEQTKPEGQIAQDLIAACHAVGQTPALYNAQAVRQEMGGVFTTDVFAPPQPRQQTAQMEYVTL